MSSHKFPKEVLEALAYDEAPEDYRIIDDEIIDHSRWSVIHQLVFEFEGVKYITNYSVGATESQDESPYQYHPNEIECRIAKERQQTVYY